MHCSSFQAVALPHREQKMPTKDSLVCLGNTRASLPLSHCHCSPFAGVGLGGVWVCFCCIWKGEHKCRWLLLKCEPVDRNYWHNHEQDHWQQQTSKLRTEFVLTSTTFVRLFCSPPSYIKTIGFHVPCVRDLVSKISFSSKTYLTLLWYFPINYSLILYICPSLI